MLGLLYYCTITIEQMHKANLKKKIPQDLYELVLAAKDKAEMSALLAALLTPNELEELIQRFAVFKGLADGKTQRDLAAEIDVSLGTVSRGSRVLKYGPSKEILAKLLKEPWRRSSK